MAMNVSSRPGAQLRDFHAVPDSVLQPPRGVLWGTADTLNSFPPPGRNLWLSNMKRTH